MPKATVTPDRGILLAGRRQSYCSTKATWGAGETVYLYFSFDSPTKRRGGMRYCFLVDLVSLDSCGVPISRDAMVAKVFTEKIKNIICDEYYSEATTQSNCHDFAENFNKEAASRGVGGGRFTFLPCHVVTISKEEIIRGRRALAAALACASLSPGNIRPTALDLLNFTPTDGNGGCLFGMEPLLKGTFDKYNSNFGAVPKTSKDLNAPRTESELRLPWGDGGYSVLRRSNDAHLTFSERSHLAECFSHFTLVQSGYAMLVCDLQGVHDVLTDPQIHTDTDEGAGLGMGNMGRDGIAKWKAAHICNELCRAMGLEPIQPSARQHPKTIRTTADDRAAPLWAQAAAKAMCNGPASVLREDKALRQAVAEKIFPRLNETEEAQWARLAKELTPKELAIAEEIRQRWA